MLIQFHFVHTRQSAKSRPCQNDWPVGLGARAEGLVNGYGYID